MFSASRREPKSQNNVANTWNWDFVGSLVGPSIWWTDVICIGSRQREMKKQWTQSVFHPKSPSSPLQTKLSIHLLLPSPSPFKLQGPHMEGMRWAVEEQVTTAHDGEKIHGQPHVTLLTSLVPCLNLKAIPKEQQGEGDAKWSMAVMAIHLPSLGPICPPTPIKIKK